MTNEKKLSQAQSVSQEELLPLEEQHLEQVTGGTGGADDRIRAQITRNIKPEIEGTNYGTYIPPSDSEALRHLHLIGANPKVIPGNRSYTFSLDGKYIIEHVQPSYTIEHKK